MEDLEKIISAAQGYSELSMHDDAVAEMDSIPAEFSDLNEVLEARLMILMHARRWKESLAVSRKICKANPDASSGFIHAAFCLHELGRTNDAKNLLVEGPESLRKEPTYHY